LDYVVIFLISADLTTCFAVGIIGLTFLQT
jgi:hypothetical protein